MALRVAGLVPGTSGRRTRWAEAATASMVMGALLVPASMVHAYVDDYLGRYR